MDYGCSALHKEVYSAFVIPRIPPLPLAQWQGQLKRSMGLAPQTEDMAQLNPMLRQVFNIMGTLANHPTLMSRGIISPCT